jgi:hypothetical protein
MLLLGVLALAVVIAALITLPVLAHRMAKGDEPDVEREQPEAKRIRRESRKWWSWPHGW